MGNFKNDILRYDKKVILSSTLQNRIILLTTNFCYSNTRKKSISNLLFFLNDITLTLERQSKLFSHISKFIIFIRVVD